MYSLQVILAQSCDNHVCQNNCMKFNRLHNDHFVNSEH